LLFFLIGNIEREGQVGPSALSICARRDSNIQKAKRKLYLEKLHVFISDGGYTVQFQARTIQQIAYVHEKITSCSFTLKKTTFEM